MARFLLIVLAVLGIFSLWLWIPEPPVPIPSTVPASALPKANQPAAQPAPATPLTGAASEKKAPAPPAPAFPAALPDLTEIPARQAYYEDLLNWEPHVLWQYWQSLANATDRNSFTAWLLAGNALPHVLRAKGNQALYREITQQLAQADINNKIGEQLPLLLGRSATPETLALLLSQAVAENNKDKRIALLRGIDLSANTRWEDRFHPELSPLLEQTWAQAKDQDDPALTNTLAAGIASVGSAAGVALLSQAVIEGGETFEALEQAGRYHLSAFSALNAVRNPEAVPVLASNLQNARLGMPIYQASGDALSQAGGIEAARALLVWAQSAPDEAAPLAGRWFSRIPDSVSRQFILDQLANHTPFNKVAIQGVVEQALRLK